MSNPSVQKTELNHQPDGEHDGNGEKPLREPCGEMEFVHDVTLECQLFPTRNTLLRAPIRNKCNA
jgi:hypothetical protein